MISFFDIFGYFSRELSELCQYLVFLSSQMAILAATLANGGQNPLTGDRIFDPFHVR